MAAMKRSAWRGYGFAVLVVLVTVLIKLVLAVTINGETPFLLLFFAVLVSAWRGGVGPGLLATGLATLAADYFFIGPPYSFAIESIGQAARLIQFVLEGTFTTFLVTALQSSSRRAERRSSEIGQIQESLEESEERYRLVIEGSNDGVWDWDIKGGGVYWNDRLFEILGLSRSEVEPSFDLFVDLIHPDDRQLTKDALTAHLERGERYEAEFRWRHASGEYRNCLGRGKVRRDASGVPVRMTGTVQDITERKQTENSQRFMSEASAVLASSLDYQKTLASVARLAVPALADWCAVDVVEEDGTVERLAVAHEDPEKVALAHELQERYPQHPEAEHGVPRVLRTGEPELVSEIPHALLDESAVDDEHRELTRRLGFRSYMVVPILARNRTLGAITLVMAESGRRYGEEDLNVAEDLARRAAVAVDNALLYDEAQREISERERAESELRRQRDLYETLLQAQSEVGEGFVIAEGSRISYANEAFCKISGYSERELLELPTFFEMFVPEERTEFLERFSRRMSGEGGMSHQEITLLHKDGRRVDLEISVEEMREDEVVQFVIIARDITDRKHEQAVLEAEARRSTELVARLELAETRYRELIERLPVVSYLAEYGPKGRWLYVSPQIESLLGFPPQRWLDDNDLWWSRVHPDDRARVCEEEELCARNLSPLSVEYRMIAADGRIVWIRDEGALGRPGDGGVVRVEGVMTDVSERRRAEDQLRHRAYHDDLTGLPNRRYFEDELRGRRKDADFAGSVAIIDVDDLKYVNDSLGHAAGDTLLRTVAASLQSALRADEFLARFGGDEFTLLLPTDELGRVRERLGEFVRAVRARKAPTPARVSVGAVPFAPDSTSTDEDLIVAADMALHDAKERGGDRHAIFAGDQHGRLAWVDNVRAAIDDERLVLHGQPIFDLRTREPLAHELLVRMIDRDGSLLPPGAFLPTAERFGLIAEIDSWVAENAVGLAAGGRSLMVNLSARSISDPGFTDRFGAVLERAGVDPGTIVFEITETAAATASDELRQFGARIERLGCGLAIDDFGTGFGSLTYLKHMPIRYLKIDMEFVRGVAGSAADRAIVTSIGTIAKSLGMRTIAEGVEDEATLDCLADIGIDFVQGFHLGRPAPLEPLPGIQPPTIAA